MPDPSRARAPSAQAARTRSFHEQRPLNRCDEGTPQTLHDQFAASDVALTEADSDWGAEVRVLGYDLVALDLDFVVGAVAGFKVAAQYADALGGPWTHLGHAADSGAVGRQVWTVAGTVITPATSGRLGWSAPSVGTVMRFKVWGEGADNTDARATLRATRFMTGL